MYSTATTILHSQFLTTPFLQTPPRSIPSLTLHHSSRLISPLCRSSDGEGGNNNGGVSSEKVEIRFRRGSKKRKQEMESLNSEPMTAKPKADPKKWEEMSMSEKAIELYVGEKGALYWLNKFAYASIYIVIGAWICFRFVGPALNLYQLDAPPLPPSAMIKGS